MHIHETLEGQIDDENIVKIKERIRDLNIRIPDYFLDNFYHVDSYMNEEIIRLQGHMTATGYQTKCSPRMLEVFNALVEPRMLQISYDKWEIVMMITMSIDIVNLKPGQTLIRRA